MKSQALLQRAQTALRAGNHTQAAAALDQLTRQFPAQLEGWFMLGQLYGMQGRHELAQRCFARVIKLNPSLPEPHFNHALASHALGDAGLAKQSFASAVQLNPDYTAAWYNLGKLQLDLGAYADAEQAFLRVLRVDRSAPIYHALGVCAQAAEQFARAADYYQQAIAQEANNFSTQLNLGTCLFCLHDYEAALTHLQAALRLDPDNSVVMHNIADCYLEMAEIDHAIEYFQRSGYPSDLSSRLYALNLLENPDYDWVFQQHQQWGEAQIAAAVPRPLPARDLSPDRILRIAYLSADFRQHPVAIFIEQVLKLHDTTRYEIHCLSDTHQPDAVTRRLQGYRLHWHATAQLSEDALIQLIHSLGIDILVDLGGHTSLRPSLLATKLAPVQISYLGHVNTTGLASVDYRLTDLLLDPPGTTEQWHTETLVRLGDHCFTYTPPDSSPDISPLPMLGNHYPTFGSFNKRYKLNRLTISRWANVMQAIPNARMLMIGRAVSTESGRASIIQLFSDYGIGADRLEFIGYLPLQDYLAVHQRIDLIMDCFPWNGHTTTMNSLWMGVPTVTIEGQHHAGRFGHAIATHLGLAEFSVSNEQAFTRRVTELVAQPEHLAELRTGMRQRMLSSPLCDHQGLTSRIDASYHSMWQSWLAKTPLTSC